MLPRRIVLTGTMQLKQRLLLRHGFYSNYRPPKLYYRLICNVCQPESSILYETEFCKAFQRRFKSNDAKIVNVKQLGDKTANTTMQDKETTKSLITAVKIDKSSGNELTTTPKISDAIAPLSETKKFEIKTQQGVLSVTTTIEDSKINEVVFEKTTPNKKPKPAGELKVNNANQIVPKLKPQLSTKTSKVLQKTTTKHSKDTTEQLEKKAKESKLGSAVDTPTLPRGSTKSAASELPTPDPKSKAKRSRVDFNRSSLERNFITPARALEDFLLKASDLENLPKIKRRSPYEQEPPITVYWRKDVEAKSIEVWGSRENLIKETLKREVERKKHQQNIFTVKRRLREYRREIGYRAKHFEDEELGLKGKSGRVVLIAIGINGINFVFKLCAWLYCGSHSMFAEAVHSLADTTNQLILAYGIHKSVQLADSDHPYGYANMRHVSSLISGVGIFCVGCGLSMYHGIMGLMYPEPITDLFWAYCILGGSLVSEGATLLVAFNKLKRSAKKEGVTVKEYILSGKDPCVNVVLTEDAAAVASVTVAASCMGLTSITGNPIYDACGSLLVGGILGGVASFIIYTNSSALVGKSISEDLLEKINSELESDCMIRAIYDVKGIHMGNSLVRYKAELDFDGRELSRFYLDKQDMNELYKVVKSFQTVEELEQFLLTHGENIVDLMGGEIDRIELKLRSKFPEIRHCDLEVL